MKMGNFKLIVLKNNLPQNLYDDELHSQYPRSIFAKLI